VKRILLISVFCILYSALLSSAAYGVVTSKANGDWSDGGTWDSDPAIPVDNDTVIVNHDVTNFDVDMSGWANGINLTINDGKSLTIKDDAGDYYLKCKSDITLNGTDNLIAGTSTLVPFTGTFTIDFNGGAYSIEGGNAGGANLYCAEPTYKWIRLSEAEIATDTVLHVDTDVTGDIWAAGDEIAIIDWATNGVEDIERRTIDAGGIAADTITITAGLTNGKLEGAYVALLTRNIVIKGSTTYVYDDIIESELYAFVDNTYGSYRGITLVLGGSMYLTGNYVSYLCRDGSLNLDGSFVCDGLGGDAVQAGYDITTTSDTLIGGFATGIDNCYNVTCDGIICGGSGAIEASSNGALNGSIWGCYTGLENCSDFMVNGDIVTDNSGLLRGSGGIIVSNCEISAGYCLNFVGSMSLYNVLFTAGTFEFNDYNSNQRLKSSYVASYKHNQVENAFRAWCRGGIATSQTASPPTGYTAWYELAVEDNDQAFPCFRQYETTVLPGTAIEVEGLIRIADGEDLSTSGKEPQLQIIDKSADPLVNSSETPLDYDIPDDVSGAETDWQAVSVIYANSGDSPKQVIVRMIAYNDGLAAVDVDTCWAVASYKEQIARLYNAMIPVVTDVATADTTTSFTLTGGTATADIYNNMTVSVQDADDAHWEVRSISDWTAGKVITVSTAFGFTPAAGDTVYILGSAYGGGSGGASAANVADAVWDELVADHTTETTFGGELGTLDPNITLILEDIGTSIPALIAAVDINDTGVASAVWSSLVAGFTDELTFGGEVGGLDPNLTLVLAYTDELQTDWANGGRLDLLIDAIKYKTDLITILDTVVKDANDANNFTIEDGVDVNDAYWFHIITVTDADDSHSELRYIEWYDENSGDPNIWVNEPFSFTPAAGDVVHVMGTAYGGYLYDIMKKLDKTRGVLNVIDTTGTGGLDRAGAIRIDALGDDP